MSLHEPIGSVSEFHVTIQTPWIEGKGRQGGEIEVCATTNQTYTPLQARAIAALLVTAADEIDRRNRPER